MSIPKYITDLIKLARLTNAKISIIKSKLSIRYADDKPPVDLLYIPQKNDNLFLIDSDGMYLIDSDGVELQTV